jgi:hypothetical protein
MHGTEIQRGNSFAWCARSQNSRSTDSLRKSMPLLDRHISKVTRFTNCLPKFAGQLPVSAHVSFSKTQIGPRIPDIFKILFCNVRNIRRYALVYTSAAGYGAASG